MLRQISTVAFLLLSSLWMGACSLLPLSSEAKPAAQEIPPPQIILFRADRSNLENGDSTMLRWEVSGADRIVIDGGVGSVGANGNMQIKPSSLSAYNLTASNAGGTVVSSVIINVKPSIEVANIAVTASSSSSPPHDALSILPKLDANEEYVFYGDAVMVGADGHYIVLCNNPAARNPTWAQLKAFLQSDTTDRCSYVEGNFTCGDFAERLHNNAEAAGLRAGIVAIELQSPDNDIIVNHSLNMFETTDRGLVYIDDTSSSQGFYADKIVNVSVGSEYIPVSLFPQPGQTQTWPSMGRVLAFDIQQW